MLPTIVTVSILVATLTIVSLSISVPVLIRHIENLRHVEKITGVSMWVQETNGEWYLVALNTTHSPIGTWVLHITYPAGNVKKTIRIPSTGAGIIPPGRSKFILHQAEELEGLKETDITTVLFFQDADGQCWQKTMGNQSEPIDRIVIPN